MPWLVKQALWQVHIQPSKEIKHPDYDVTKPNEQYQFDILYVSHIMFLKEINISIYYQLLIMHQDTR